MRAHELTFLLALAAGCGVDTEAGRATDPRHVAQPTSYEEVFERELTFEERVAAARAEAVPLATPEEVARAEAAVKALRAKRVRDRELRMWMWESPADTRARVWNVPVEESAEAEATALLRICISEADGSEADCVGIWQVLRNIRSRECDRATRRRITECEDGTGETMLSVMRRAQRYATGVLPPRSARSRWIAELRLDCARPPTFPGNERAWRGQYGRSCGSTAALARRLVAGEHVQPSVVGARPITWGGRCEDPRGACDDPIACARGLARIPDTDTLNAFWCVPGTAGCAPTVDPLCAAYRRRHGMPVEEAALPAADVDVEALGGDERLPEGAAQAGPVGDEGEPVT